MMFWYFVENVKTGEEKIQFSDNFIGDIGEHIFLSGEEYVINDYAEEFEELEIPEDFNY